jgi:hypothetical protein
VRGSRAVYGAEDVTDKLVTVFTRSELENETVWIEEWV